MKAAQISQYGGPSVITINGIPAPTIEPGKVLVSVRAVSLNPFDTTIREGYMKEMIPLKFPVTLGGDIAGVVSEVAPDVIGVKVGDNIYGQASAVAGNSGAFAEYALTVADQIAPMPSSLNFTEAASLPLVGASALQALLTHLMLQADQKIFIHGGSGGIGSIAVQVAKHLGAYVATTARGDGLDFVKQLGADETIDYTKENFYEKLGDFDAVFDTVGGEDFSRSFSILKPGGRAVSMIAPPDEAKAKEHGVMALMQQTRVTTELLQTLSELVDKGVVKPQVAKVYPFEQVKEAFEARENESVHGKIVLKLS